MFKEKTTFILGAGASKDYGYPTGKELIDKIIEAIERDTMFYPSIPPISRACNLDTLRNSGLIKENYLEYILFTQTNDFTHQSFHSLQTGQQGGYSLRKINLSEFDELIKLKDDLKQFDPISIDKFLKDHPRHNLAGRVMICYCLLKLEDEKAFIKNGSSKWYRLLINEITGCVKPNDIFKNDLEIVTFNYDPSLDYYLNHRLREMEFFNDVAEEYLNKFNIFHVYGKLRTLDKKIPYGMYNHIKEKHSDSFANMIAMIYAMQFKDNIKLMTERELNPEELRPIRQRIKESKNIFILGFGFDETNQALLELNTTLKTKVPNGRKPKSIYWLNYEGEYKRLSDNLHRLKDTDNYRGINIISSTHKSIEKAWIYDFMTDFVH